MNRNLYCKHQTGKTVYEKPRGKRNAGFTVMEMVIVLAIMGILLLLVGVGLNGYIDSADKIERTQVAESSYYALQSYLALEKRQGNLKQFTESVKAYNASAYGDELVLSKDENRIIIESNYEGSDFSSYYTNDYEVQHADSEIVCLRLDAGTSIVRKGNPLYSILFSALKDEDILEYSFFAEFDSNSGIVRSVFFSKDAAALEYHFLQDTDIRQENITDVIERNTASLDKKRQGYCGVLETSGLRQQSTITLLAPDDLEIINGDRLYVTWSEANLSEPLFVSGVYDLGELQYTLKLYNTRNELVTEYVLKREEIWKDTIGTGTIAEALNALDDSATVISSVSTGQVTRAAGNSFLMEHSMYGVAEERYFVLLECLDHSFASQGYDLNGEQELYAVVSVEYQGEAIPAEESDASNVVSAYFESVSSAVVGEDTLYTYEIGCSRHLYNMRQGMPDGNYQITADIHWENIEGRARDILFEPVVYQSREYIGVENPYSGTLAGNSHTVWGLRILDTGSYEVGLLRTSNGEISDIVFENANITGVNYVGLAVGRNFGSISSLTVKNSNIFGKDYAGGVVGTNSGTMEDIAVLSTDVTGGKYVGGVMGYQNAAGMLQRVEAGSSTNQGVITGVTHVGGAVGGTEGTLDTVNNYNQFAVLVPQERSEYATATTYVHTYFGGIAGEIIAGNVTKCRNQNLLSLKIYDADGQLSVEEAAAYVSNPYDMPRMIGGVAGGNAGSLKNSYSQMADAKNNEQGIAEYISKKDTGTYLGDYVGGIAGENTGSILVEDGLFTDNTMKLYVEGNSYVGGIVGLNQGTVTAPALIIEGNIFSDKEGAGGAVAVFESGIMENAICNKALVIGESAGGIISTVKAADFVLQNCVNEGFVIAVGNSSRTAAGGGIVGKNEGTILNCTNRGIVTGDLAYDHFTALIPKGYASIGGVAGLNYKIVQNCHSVSNADNTNYLSGNYYVGGLVGNHVSGTETAKILTNTTEEVNIPIFANAYTQNQTYNAIGGIVGVATGSMELNGFRYSGKIISQNDWETIRDEEGCAVGGIVGVLGKDNVINSCEFSGTIAAAGNRVGGLIGYAGETGGKITNSVVHKTASIEGKDYVGGLAGLCYAEDIQMDTALFESTVKGRDWVGGYIGYTRSLNELTRVNKGTVSGRNNVGGFMGYAKIQGAQSGLTNRGLVSATEGNVGGIAGVLSGSAITFTNCLNESVIEGSQGVGGLIGNVYDNCTVTLTDCDNQNVAGEASYIKCRDLQAGGIIGRSTGENNVISLLRCYNDMGIEGNYIGGLIGHSAARQIQITECVNSGSIGKNTENAITVQGGLIGAIEAETGTYTISSSRNEGGLYHYQGTVITAASTVQGAGGLIGFSATNMTIADCKNGSKDTEKGSIYLSSGSNTILAEIGGLVGRIRKNLLITDSVNYGEIAGSSGVKGQNLGGIVGNIGGTAQIYRSQNYGNIGRSIEGSFSVCSVGGIVGKVSENVGASYIEDCVQNAQILSVAKNDEGAGAGGIVGYSASQLSVISCNNGVKTEPGTGDIFINTGGDYSAGIVGRAIRKVTIDRCNNYGDIEVDTLKVAGERSSRIGGIVGGVVYADASLESRITNCKQLGNITNVYYNVGGIIGYSECPMYIEGCTNGSTENPVAISCMEYEGITGGIGGIAGQAKVRITIKGCENYADLDGEGDVSYLGGMIGMCACNFAIEDSANYGDLQKDAKGQVYGAGGMIGVNNYADGAKGSLINCVSTGNIYNVHGGTNDSGSVGGMIGHNAAVLTVQNCINGKEDDNNTGNIYPKEGARTFGGIIGFSSKKIEVSGCINYGDIYAQGLGGDFCGGIVGYSKYGDAESLSTIRSCKQYGNLYGLRGYGGGIIGAVNCPMVIEDCENGISGAGNTSGYMSIEKDVQNVGGIVGASGKNLTISNCTNYGNLETKGTVSAIGGIIGYNNGVLTIGRADGSVLGAKNYGSIKAVTGATVRNIGGIVGKSDANLLVYDCENYGDLAPDNSGELYSAGGMVGYVEGPDEGASEIRRCLQKGAIYNSKGEVSNAGAGGIAGFVKAPVTVSDCQNDGTIYMAGGSIRNGGILGGNFKTLTMTGCINNGILSGTGAVECVGGMIGFLGNAAVIDSCTNNGEITAATVTAAGGIVGQVDHGNGENTLTNCIQNGIIRNIKGSVASAGAGGIIGFNQSATTITNCYNGQDDGSDKGMMTALDGAIRIGGIVGAAYVHPLTVNSCVNYGKIVATGNLDFSGGVVGCMDAVVTLYAVENKGTFTLQANGVNLGGIIGAFYAKEITIDKCINYASFTATGNLINLGGIIGMNSGKSNIGTLEEEGSFGAKNYGTLQTAGGNITNVGGIIGHMENSTVTKNSENYGNIVVAGGGGIYNTAGIIGHTVGSGEITIFGCANFADIKVSANVGGILGLDEGNGMETIVNCYAIGEVRGGGAGALIGIKGNPANLSVTDSYGSTDKTDGNKVISTVSDWSVLAGYEFNGGTQGVFGQGVYDTLCAYFGIENRWDGADMSNNVRYLIANYQ